MIRQLLIPVLGAISLAYCTNSGKEPIGSKTGTGNKVSQCFASINNRDTVMLRLVMTDNIVTGELTYHLFEKDKSHGTLVGEMKGDTLFADYKFNSEGMTSERELAFLRSGNSLMEGYGDIEEKNGKVKFKDHATLNFSDNMILKKLDCQ